MSGCRYVPGDVFSLAELSEHIGSALSMTMWSVPEYFSHNERVLDPEQNDVITVIALYHERPGQPILRDRIQRVDWLLCMFNNTLGWVAVNMLENDKWLFDH